MDSQERSRATCMYRAKSFMTGVQEFGAGFGGMRNSQRTGRFSKIKSAV